MANSILTRVYLNNKFYALPLLMRYSSNISIELDDEFRTLDILPKKRAPRDKRKTHFSYAVEDRYKKLETSVDWSSVWPSQRTFHPSTVPLPLYMGYRKQSDPPLNKYHNPELIKIPNFLHITPKAVKKHCAALKKFCTDWPQELDTDEKCDQYFPVQLETCDFVFSGSSLRWPQSRQVKLSVNISSLPLDYHARDKMMRLLMEKFNRKKNKIMISTDRCPLRKQNYDYAIYLLTAVFFESWKTEEWESEKTEADWERFYWEKSRSKETIVKYMQDVSPDSSEQQILDDESIKKFAKAVCDLSDVGENANTLENYKQSVIKLLF